jgi:hypothetical protein
MSDLEHDLADTDRSIADAHARIGRQQELIEELWIGGDAAAASAGEELLQTLVFNLRRFEQQRSAILSELGR